MNKQATFSHNSLLHEYLGNKLLLTSQLAALLLSQLQNVLLIIGAPGTGKSYTAGRLALNYLLVAKA